MGLFTKDDQKRLDETFAYIKGLKPPEEKYELLRQWVYDDGWFEPLSISTELSIDAGVFNKVFVTSSSERKAVRSAVLTRLAAEAPDDLTPCATWKAEYKRASETANKQSILSNLSRLAAPALIPSGAPVPTPKAPQYGVSLNVLQGALGGLKPTVQQPKAAPTNSSGVVNVAPQEAASTAQKLKFFEDESRVHVVLSGHGSWTVDGTGNGPFVNLGKHQQLKAYIPHYWPLGNDVGQLVDGRRFPAPRDAYGPGARVFDYTLHPKDKLKLLNHKVGDRYFETVTSNTRLSVFLNKPEYASATFHWAACRVVFNPQGKVWCPTHRRWETFDGSLPQPCVLTQVAP